MWEGRRAGSEALLDNQVVVVDAGWWSNGRVSDIRTVAVVVRMVLDDFLQQKKDLFV